MINSNNALSANAVNHSDSSAFFDFYDKYAPAFYGLAIRTLYEPNRCAETVQKAFINIFYSLKEYDDQKERLFSWTLRIVQKEVSKVKIEMALEQLFACRQLPVNNNGMNSTTNSSKADLTQPQIVR